MINEIERLLKMILVDDIDAEYIDLYGVAAYAAAETTDLRIELARKDAALEAAQYALRAVKADRPSVHSDAVWRMINVALAALDGEK
jgi:hypothetical protein